MRGPKRKDPGIGTLHSIAIGMAGWLAGVASVAQAAQTVALGPSRQVPPTLIGANGTMTRDQFKYTTIDPWGNAQNVADLKKTGISLLRYPGGTFGNYYDWTEGHYIGKPSSSYHYTAVQTKPATDAMDGKMVWMLNVITETLADVTNALGLARDHGVEVKYVELGNEFYFSKYDPSDTANYDPLYIYPEGVTNGWVDGTAYGNDMNAWVAALKAGFPDALVSLPFDRGIVDNASSRRGLWNGQVASACTNYDAMSVHVYTDSLVGMGYGDTTDASEQTEQWNYFTGDTNAVQLFLGAAAYGWAQMVNHPNFSVPTNKPIWFTEFGVKPATMPWVVKGTWADGLADFTFYHTLLSYPQAELLTEQQYIDLNHGGTNEFSSVKIDVGQDLSGTLGTLTAEGHVVHAISSVAYGKEVVTPLVFDEAAMVSPPGIDPYPALIGILFSDAAESSAIIANISDQPQEIDTASLGPVGATVTQMSADHFYTFIVSDSDVNYTNFAMGATLALPPFTLCTITGLQRSQATAGDRFTPRFSGSRIAVYASDDMAHTRPIAWDAADQDTDDTLSYSLTGINPSWVSANGTNGLAFSPAPIGSYEVYVRVEDSYGLTDYATFDVNVVDGSVDSDGDGLVNNDEILMGTNPTLADTDGDGYSDSEDPYPLDPTRPGEGPVPVPTWVPLEKWTYDGVADGTALDGAGTESTTGTGLKWAATPLAVVSNQMQRWEYDGVKEAAFQSPVTTGSSYENATTGFYQVSYDVPAADFSNTAAAGGTAQFGYGIRDNTLGENGTLLVRFASNQFWLKLLGDSSVQRSIAAGSLVSNLHVRAVYDLDNAGFAGSFIGYFSIDGGPETAVTNQLAANFTLETLRMHVQTINGGNGWAQGDVAMVDNIALSDRQWVVTPESHYAYWLTDYPAIGSATNAADNPDGDALDNLAEYALGGDPSDAADVGHVPLFQPLEAGGSSVLEYVYARRNDAAARGLAYSLELSSDLVSNHWTAAPAEEVGTAVLDAQFDTVTNRVAAPAGNQAFLRLRVEMR